MRRSNRIASKKNYQPEVDDLEKEDHYNLMENPKAEVHVNIVRPRRNLCTARVMVVLATFITVVLILMFPLNVDASVEQVYNPLRTQTHPKIKFTKIEV